MGLIWKILHHIHPICNPYLPHTITQTNPIVGPYLAHTILLGKGTNRTKPNELWKFQGQLDAMDLYLLKYFEGNFSVCITAAML